MKNSNTCNIVALERFIEATRDTGYRNIVYALSELVDNAFEAHAQRVEIKIEKSLEGFVTVTTIDDGSGMQPEILQTALQFGGSTRFNSRQGMGRFGMGLPNSSLSQARRINVITWENYSEVWGSYLDVDEIVAGKLTFIPKPQRTKSDLAVTKSGTIIIWTKCDRIEFKNEKVFLRKIRTGLGRIFRKHLWTGREIIVCGEKVEPLDPIYLTSPFVGQAKMFGDELKYEVSIPGTGNKTSPVTVQFVELPIEKWHNFSNEKKQSLGISKGAGISVIRAGREVDYGWFFMGKKRKENYDDWWRCEINFEPDLDELFGVTNNKQGIRPREILNSILTPDLERIAHLLNSRVRSRYATVKTEAERTTGQRIAARRDHLLEPPKVCEEHASSLLHEVAALSPTYGRENDLIPGLNYRIEAKRINEGSFFVPLLSDREIVVLLNQDHPFYECVYSPSMRLSNRETRLVRQHLELTILAAARAECVVSNCDNINTIREMREEWSRTLATFLE